jgi:outer membrane protein assembly factor BamB
MSDQPQFSPAAPASEPTPIAAGHPPHPVDVTVERRLRLWPALLIVGTQWLASIVATKFFAGEEFWFYAVFMGPMVAGGLFLLWWLFASRVRWRDRLLVFGLLLVASVCLVLLDQNPHVGGFKLMLYALPVTTAAWTVWLLISRGLSWSWRRAGVLAIIVAVFGWFNALRLDGVTGSMKSEMSWRWSPTAEDRSLAEIKARKAAAVPAPEAPLTLQPGDWPGFRGPERDGRLTGVKIDSDWAKHPPKLLWKQRVGPGWSSFAVIGDRLYTQEQRGEDEVVVCYDAATGKELWLYRDSARFTEAVGGPGPRATPTFHEGKLYTVGAKGRVNCLDAATGKLIWTRDMAADTGAKVPEWAFASSPLVIGGLVAIFAGGPDDKAVQAYDAATGEPKWAAGKGTHSYSSPQRATIDGVEQILIVTDQGLTGLEPQMGKVLWNYDWDLKIQRVVQPAQVGPNDFLIGTTFAKGTRRVHVEQGKDGWKVSEVWASRAFSPYFNDLVVHHDNLYGFDGEFLSCINLEDGKRRWKERGYGNGQVLLLADQDLLLVLAETGEVALVAAQPGALKELARIPALEGKTWNHPVLAHGKLYLRNSEEMACFEVPMLTKAANK